MWLYCPTVRRGRVRVRAICRYVIDISLKSTIASLASYGFPEADGLVKGEPELFCGQGHMAVATKVL